MTTTGTVREWHDDEGWGVIDSAATPGGCWVHFSSLLMNGYRRLDPGRGVTLEFEPGPQDGFGYRAVAVWIGDQRPGPSFVDAPSGAYRSILRLEFDEPPSDAGGLA